MKTHFYDIESLDNVFTLCNYKPDENDIDIYYLCDDAHLTAVANFKDILLQRIYERNRNFNGTIALHNLRYEDANRHLAKTFGLSDAYLINDPKSNSSYSDEFRLVCDTDPNYDEDAHPYLMGYNSYNYDTTELTLYLYDVFPIIGREDETGKLRQYASFTPTTAYRMRLYNNELFSPQFKDSMPTRLTQNFDNTTKRWSDVNYSDTRWRIRKNMLLSGRHLDVAKLNEKQSKVGLKRLLGMLGFQILESDKLKQGTDHIDTLDQLLDLIAYNVSDCVNLEELFKHKLYTGQFKLKKQLLNTYPELIYDKLPDAYAPDIRPEKVRRDRMTIDSSSAQLSTKALCPYGHLKDIPTVSFWYPSENKAKELGIQRVNVLDEAKKFFYKHFGQYPELCEQFDIIYNYYKSIEGRNFNESKNYEQDFKGTPEYRPPENIAKLPKINMNRFYYNADGTPSSCFVTFSTGGIHGAEFNKVLFEHDVEEFEKDLARMQYVQQQYPDPIDLKKAKTVEIDGIEYKSSYFLKSGSTLKKSNYKDFEANRPVLFKTDEKGITKLNTKYVFTSTDPTNHEDFTSYYPNLLRMMEAFYNTGLHYDRYAEIFDNKQDYGFLMKEKNQDLTPELAEKYQKLRTATGLTIEPLHISDKEREMYDILRDGTKLILNSASGAADATFESNIRMNNTIISMRIIGQLFSWRIGQAQTIKGAKITSTNTDGLYSVLAAEINNPILAQESADIGVEIEPEPTYLISKDSNNRIEMNPDDGTVESASGGTLGCRKGPNPAKALNHPAIIDWALTEYLICAALHHKATLSAPFNDELGLKILESAKTKFKPIEFLKMFQNVIASSIGSMNYIFAITDENITDPIIMQHYNRVFIMKDKTPNTVHLYAANARQITPAQTKKRRENAERAQQHDDVAIRVLNNNGVKISDLPNTKEAIVKKVTNIDDRWYMLIQNKALADLTDEELTFIMDNIDYEKYLQLLRDGFEKNWRNKMPEGYEESIGHKVTTKEPESEQSTENVQNEGSNNDHCETSNTKSTNVEPQKDQNIDSSEPTNGSECQTYVYPLQTKILSGLNECLGLAKQMEHAVDIQEYLDDYVEDVCQKIQTAIDAV